MSVEALTIALHHSRAKGTARLVLIGIANHDGDGGSWPALATLSKYAGGVDRKTVKRAVDQLERLHEVQQIDNGGGDRDTPEHLRPNLYRFLLTCPPDCDRSRNHRTRRGRSIPEQLDLSTQGAPTPPGAQELSTGGAPTPRGEGAPTPPEPSIEETPRERSLDDVQTARESVCDVTGAEHEYSRSRRCCVYCGQKRPR